MKRTHTRRYTGLLFLLALWPLGCAGPGPKLFPVTPIGVQSLSTGGWRREYDTNADGCADAYETLSAEGLITAIGYDADPSHDIILRDVPAAEQRHLVLLLDSIPFELADEAWIQGRLRDCHRPSRSISPFPVMTDLSFDEFFGCSPSAGIESSYYNGKKLTSGYDVYAQGGNVPWQHDVDYHMNPVAHVSAYLDPYPWLNHELHEIAAQFLKRDDPITIGYAVGTSAVGASKGRNGHQIALVRLDRFCQRLMFQTRGRTRFTLMSDHGHAFYDSKRVPFHQIMTKMGYRVRESLKGPNDVVIPEFGMVSFAAIHTQSPARVAHDVVGIESVELAAYPENDQIIVLSPRGHAVISRRGESFRYQPLEGDPLQLQSVLDQLTKSGQVSADGYIDDHVLFEATTSATYPDVVARLWRSFHGLVEHTPQVLVSLADGYHAGSATMTSMIDLIGVHGSLRQQSSSGMVMTAAGDLPPIVRMSELKAALQHAGVPFKPTSTTTPSMN